ncbi:MAG: pknB 29 [Planctomycetota bacterium]|nr:pknB 29 [Planctomycetota bacterium]
MTQEEAFLAAMDLPDPAERNAYLDEVCGGDVAFRQQVKDLLAAHFKTGEFLDEPVGKQMGVDLAAPIHDYFVSRHVNLLGDIVEDEKKPEDEPEDLHFLEPASRPDSLGRIGHYEVLQVIGKGGFGIVFRAFDDVLQRVVALKMLAPAMAATSPARKRFLREARSFAQVRHESVVQVYAIEEQPLPYLVMEFIPGESLQERLDRTGPLEVTEIIRLGRQIAEGLAAAHATGLIHRDIKPGNVLIEGGHQQAKITDFGLARAADDASLTQSGVLAGTPMYMAPEQAKGETLDHRADLFSLGSVLYVMASGRPPFRASTTYAVLKRLVEDNPRPIREVIPEIPHWLCDIIEKLHAKKPADRFQSAQDVADLLADCEAQLKASGKIKDFSRIPKSRRAVKGADRWKWVAALALLFPVFALAMTEIGGFTHLVRGRQSASDGSKGVNARQMPQARPENIGRPADYTNTLGMKFRLIPSGKFTMGSSQKEIDHFHGLTEDERLKGMFQSEGPEHEVEITQPFYMGMTEVTIGQFRQFIEANPKYVLGDDIWNTSGRFHSENNPVVQVSWQDAFDFCKWLSEKEGREYRLPTEAEWEYCCRAGRSGMRYCYGNDDAELEKYAWFSNNSGGGTHPVGKKLPNAWGLYDMYGNAFELCQDWHDLDYYKSGSVKDPTGPLGSCRVSRGGGWKYPPMYARSAFRSWATPHLRSESIGFRVCLVAPPAAL